ncbi:MAG: uroporphyrinogen decarboxylase family protein [Chloroflexota bacterium]
MLTQLANPRDWERDLGSAELRELELYTQWARRRLLERDVSIKDLKRAFFANESLPQPPLLIPDFPARLVGAELRDYYVNTVTHYKAYCAGLARFGQDLAFTYTATWEYRLVETLGGELADIQNKAPETTVYPIASSADLNRTPAIDYDDLVSGDLALKRYADKKLGDLMGPGMFVTLDPFSEVASLLRDPQNLMLDLIDNPAFVHDLCSYMFEIQRQILRRVLAVGPIVLFAPGYLLMLSPRQFQEFAFPYIEKLIAEFPGVPMIIGSGGKANRLIEPFMKSSIPVPFIDGASDLRLAVEKAKEYHKPLTVLFPRSVLMKGNRDEIRSTTRQLLGAAKGVPFYYWSEAILGGDVPNPAIDLFIEAYRDYARFPLGESLEQEPMRSPSLRRRSSGNKTVRML